MTAPNRQRIALLGNPTQAGQWESSQLDGLARDGYTGVQINIAWAYRPNDEVLNLEDIMQVPGSPEPNSLEGAAGRPRRAAILRSRASMAHDAGLKTILHVGMPYQGRAGYDGDPLPQCISDPATSTRYTISMAELAKHQPDVDELLIYTFDQDAWICSEFKGCNRCAGIPLHHRLPTFLNAVAAAWAAARPTGRIWWEPWELSTGQTLAVIPQLDASTIGLMIHSSIAEVMSAMAGDEFVHDVGALASRRGIPVIAEVFLSASNEEVEPWHRLPVPCITLQQLRNVEAVPGILGVKEYYGLLPSPFDVNARVAAAYFGDPKITDDAALASVASTFGQPWLKEFWRRTSAAYRLYPWNASWFARELGYSDPSHELSAAIIRGSQSNAPDWDTPAWRSSRGAIFMRTTNREAHPWELEDMELRFATAADAMTDAVSYAQRHGVDVGRTAPDEKSREIQLQVEEATGFVIRCRAYQLHLRETNLALLLRDRPERQDLVLELRDALVRDLANQQAEIERVARSGDIPPVPSQLQLEQRWIVDRKFDLEPIERAIADLDSNLGEFLSRYFLPGAELAAAGQFSLTSR